MNIFSLPPSVFSLPILRVRDGDFVADEIQHKLMERENENEKEQEQTKEFAASSSSASVIDRSQFSSFYCSSCRCPVSVSFDLLSARLHYHSAWHLANTRRAVREETPISLEEFQESVDRNNNQSNTAAATATAAETDAEAPAESDEGEFPDSDSASDSSTDTDSASGLKSSSSHIAFETEFSTYFVSKSLLFHPKFSWSKEEFPRRAVEFVSQFRSLGGIKPPTIAVFLAMGGRFSGAIFSGPNMIKHKSFQRYTVRAKQGGSQEKNDSHAGGSGAAQSIGSSIRRHEAVRFVEEIHRLLGDWRSSLASCSLIYLFAPSSNRRIFFQPAFYRDPKGSGGEIQVNFDAADTRIRSVAVTVQRPTTEELKRVYQKICFVDIQQQQKEQPTLEIDSKHNEIQSQPAIPLLPLAISAPQIPSVLPMNPIDFKILESIQSNDLSAIKSIYSDSAQLAHRTLDNPAVPMQQLYPLYEAVKFQRFEILEFLLTQPNELEFIDIPTVESPSPIPSNVGPECWTVLHRACFESPVRFVSLLLKFGASPMIRDARGKFASNLTGKFTSEIRQFFRKFAFEEIQRRAGNSQKQREETQAEAETESETAEEKDNSLLPIDILYPPVDWSLLGIEPESLAEFESRSQLRLAHLREKRRAAKLRSKNRVKAEKAAEESRAAAESALRLERIRVAELTAEKQKISLEREIKLLALSDREKRALASESRLAALKGAARVCFQCGKLIQTIPFQKGEKFFCTVQCMQEQFDQAQVQAETETKKITKQIKNTK